MGFAKGASSSLAAAAAPAAADGPSGVFAAASPGSAAADGSAAAPPAIAPSWHEPLEFNQEQKQALANYGVKIDSVIATCVSGITFVASWHIEGESEDRGSRKNSCTQL